MRNRDLPMFPITETNHDYDHQGRPRSTQKTVGGLTKFEQGVLMIAQGLAQNEMVVVEDIDKLSVDIAGRIFDRIEKETK